MGGRFRGVAVLLAVVLTAMPAAADPVDCVDGLASKASAQRPHGIDAENDERPWAHEALSGPHYDLRSYWIGEPSEERFTLNLRVTDLAAAGDMHTVIVYRASRTITVSVDHLGTAQFSYGHIEQSSADSPRSFITDGTTTGSLDQTTDVITVDLTAPMLVGVGDFLDLDEISAFHRTSVATGLGNIPVAGPATIVDEFSDGVFCRAHLRQAD